PRPTRASSSKGDARPGAKPTPTPSTRQGTKVVPTAIPTPAPLVASVGSVDDSAPVVTYTGAWKQAWYRAYAGRAVRYATDAGATATVRFDGRTISWLGPVGPTRGSARVTIDGKLVATVDLSRPRFAARNVLFQATVAGRSPHVLTITVVGTAGHPMVAIDEFVVAP
ncbi:MAG TPA: hypothetical protein VEG29_08595, partial [Candidatus Binatia bacterium]|nr:hypothetical protein [Candidatus Binatia bacterium]